MFLRLHVVALRAGGRGDLVPEAKVGILPTFPGRHWSSPFIAKFEIAGIIIPMLEDYSNS